MTTEETKRIAERIALRQSLGLTSEQYRALLDQNVAKAKRRVSLAINECVLAGMRSEEAVKQSHLRFRAAECDLQKALSDQKSGILT